MENFEIVMRDIDKYGSAEIADYLQKCNVDGGCNYKLLVAMVEYYNCKYKGTFTIVNVPISTSFDYETMARNQKSHVGETVSEMTVPGINLDGEIFVKPRVTTRK